MQKFTIKVSKTIKQGEKLKSGKTATTNEREEVGSIDAFTPLLDEIAKHSVAVKQAQAVDKNDKPLFDAAGTPVLAIDDDGLPVHETEEANWILSAIVAAVKAQARNKLLSGTATLKDGAIIPSTWAELVAEGERTGSAALAALRDCQNAFVVYVGTLGKKESTAVRIITLFKNRDALALQDTPMKMKMKEYVEAFGVTLSEDDLIRFEKPLGRVLETCDSVSEDPLNDM